MPIAELKKMATPREVFLFVGAMLALVFVFFSFVYKPNGEKITQQKDRIKGIETDMITLKKDIGALKQKNEAKQVQRAQSTNPKIQILKNEAKPEILKTSELIKKISSDDFVGDMIIISLALQPSVESTGYIKKSFLLKVRGTFDEIISFLGALFYLFNLGTMQMFFLPFEAFSSFFAFLPWSLWSFLRVISIRQLAERNPARESSEINQKYASLDSSTAPSSRFARSGSARNDIMIFSLINLLGSPSFYTQALFAVYLLAVFCLLAAAFLSSRFSSIQMKINLFKKTSLIFILIFILNSYFV